MSFSQNQPVKTPLDAHPNHHNLALDKIKADLVCLFLQIFLGLLPLLKFTRFYLTNNKTALINTKAVSLKSV